MTKVQEKNLIGFKDWFIKQPDEDYTQRLFQGACGTPHCVMGHLAYHAAHILKAYKYQTLYFTSIETYEIYGISPGSYIATYDYGSYDEDDPVSKLEAVTMLEHLIDSKGKEVEWPKPT